MTTPPFADLGTNIGNPARLSTARTHSISAENVSGAPGQGGMATEGTGAVAALRMYWDGEVTPSVKVPLGDFDRLEVI